MILNDSIIQISSLDDINRGKLLEQWEDMDKKPYYDPKYDRTLDWWLQAEAKDGYGYEIGKRIQREFNLSEESGPETWRCFFYNLKKGATLPLHKDRGTECSFNFVLSDGSDNVSFEDGEMNYRTALLNTQKMHGVFNTKEDRILFKVSIKEKTFEEIKGALNG